LKKISNWTPSPLINYNNIRNICILYIIYLTGNRSETKFQYPAAQKHIYVESKRVKIFFNRFWIVLLEIILNVWCLENSYLNIWWKVFKIIQFWITKKKKNRFCVNNFIFPIILKSLEFLLLTRSNLWPETMPTCSMLKYENEEFLLFLTDNC